MELDTLSKGDRGKRDGEEKWKKAHNDTLDHSIQHKIQASGI
jgi:hypothetical protein